MGEVVYADFGAEPELTKQELADRLLVPVGTVDRWAKEGLPYRLEGIQRLFKESAARNWRGSDRKGEAHAG